MKYILTLIIAVILIIGFLVYQGIYIPVDHNSEETVRFLVKKGDSAKDIANNLKQAGLIRYVDAFKLYASMEDKADKLTAGEYDLSFSMNIPEIINKLSSGDRIKKIITIIEGWDLKDIKKYLEEQGIEVGELDPKLEGYLFPDTYELSPEDGIVEIIKMMTDNFGEKVNNISEETLIMASLIEKEVRAFEDKKIVSGILWKRIETNMPLQVDATIIYLTGKSKVLLEDLEIDSSYNTYKYKGLPIGPICNPGLESIEAAINPQETDYWFYLSSLDGKTIYSKNFKEHQEAIDSYLK
jgi:UPF0755 protein